MKKQAVIISGYFDPIHMGHVELIYMAKQLGDVFVIVNNNCQSVLKKGYYFMDEIDRKVIIDSIKGVTRSFISIDRDRSVCRSLVMAFYDVGKKYERVAFANGGDRNKSNIPEVDVCNKYGIIIVDGLGKKIQSSSELIKNAHDKITLHR